MIIWIEGPDGSGKTTLNGKITGKFYKDIYIEPKAEKMIPTKPKEENRVDERTMFTKLRQMALDSKKVYIMERGPISDVIYRIFDDYRAVTTPSKLINFIREYEDKIFFIYCNAGNAEELMLKRGDDNPVSLQKHKEITRLYNLFVKELFRYMSINRTTFDFNKNSTKTLLDKLDYFIRMSRR